MATNRKLSWSNAKEVRRSLAAINNMLLNDNFNAVKKFIRIIYIYRFFHKLNSSFI